MALVLSMKENEDFYVGSEAFVVSSVDRQGAFDLFRCRDRKRFTITEAEGIEVMTDVFVSSGRGRQIGVARVAIDAPQDMLILRGESYRAQHARMEIR